MNTNREVLEFLSSMSGKLEEIKEQLDFIHGYITEQKTKQQIHDEMTAELEEKVKNYQRSHKNLPM